MSARTINSYTPTCSAYIYCLCIPNIYRLNRSYRFIGKNLEEIINQAILSIISLHRRIHKLLYTSLNTYNKYPYILYVV